MPVLPGSNYIGPGNDDFTLEPTNQSDSVARTHDLDYNRIQNEVHNKLDFIDEIHQADKNAIKGFLSSAATSFLNPINLVHGIIGAVGIGAKHLVEKHIVQDIIYPKMSDDDVQMDEIEFIQSPDSSTHGTKRPNEEAGPAPKATKTGSGQGHSAGGDGTAPGGVSYTLWPTVRQQMQWRPFQFTKRVIKTYRDWTSYTDLDTTQVRAFTIPHDAFAVSINTLTDVGDARIINTRKVRFSNLIIMNDSIENISGTTGSATTFNASPYILVLKDRVNTKPEAEDAFQFNTPTTQTVADWTLNDIMNFNTFTDIGAQNQRHMDALLWKQGDDALLWDMKPDTAFHYTNGTSEAARQSCPMSNFRLTNLSKSFLPSGTYFNKTNSVGREQWYFCVPEIKGANGSIKFSFSMVIEETVTGSQLVSDDGNALNSSALRLGSFVAGARPCYINDIRTPHSGDLLHVSAYAG